MRILINFGIAAIQHVLNKFPTCNQKQVDGRLSICYDCKFFKKNKAYPTWGVCTHANCGCSVGGDPNTFLNKVAWADQECPIGKWGKIEPNEPT